MLNPTITSIRNKTIIPAMTNFSAEDFLAGCELPPNDLSKALSIDFLSTFRPIRYSLIVLASLH